MLFRVIDPLRLWRRILERLFNRRRSMLPLSLTAIAVGLMAVPATVHAEGGRGGRKGLNREARRDLRRTGINRYLNEFEPERADVIGDWTRYTFDKDGGRGPICVDGSDFRVFVQERNPRKLIVFLPGGGACWQGQYACAFSAPMNPPGSSGLFADDFTQADGTVINNPLEDFSKVVISYCDGSIYAGDNDVNDMTFPGGPVRYHRGVRNISAGLDLAKDLFPRARRVLLTGASAGGYGVSGVSAMLIRFKYPRAQLRVFNDSGPLNNPAFVAGINAQVADWNFTQFYPSTCTSCGPFNQPSEIVKWWLANDNRMKAGLFSYDGDAVIRFFIQVPTPAAYRSLLLSVFDPINAAYPKRYKRYIAAGTAHTILGSSAYYNLVRDNVPFYEWLDDLTTDGVNFVDIVEPAQP